MRIIIFGIIIFGAPMRLGHYQGKTPDEPESNTLKRCIPTGYQNICINKIQAFNNLLRYKGWMHPEITSNRKKKLA
jgi:hypothetical protein